jgi:hypothetical protein
MAKTHDIRKFLLVVAGIPVTGFAEGDAFSLEFDEDDWNLTVGADGESARSYIPNRAGTLSINLMATSLSNDAMNAARLLDEATGLGQFPVLIRNVNGSEGWSAAQAWVQAPAAISVGRDVGSREWTIRSGEWIPTPGNGGQPI